MTNIIQAMNWRYATKAYDSNQKLNDTQISTLIEAIRLAPASFGLSTYKVIHVKDVEVREKLKAAAWGQTQLSDASDLLVFAVKTNLNESDVTEFIEEIAKVRNVPIESLSEYANMIKSTISSRSDEQNIVWASKQAYIGLGVLISAAALEEIDATPMEGFDVKQFDEILRLKELGLTTSVICAVGFRSEKDAYAALTKVRMSKDSLVIER